MVFGRRVRISPWADIVAAELPYHHPLAIDEFAFLHNDEPHGCRPSVFAVLSFMFALLPHYWNFIGTEISQPPLVNWSTLLTTVPFNFTFLNRIGPTFFPVILAGRLGV